MLEVGRSLKRLVHWSFSEKPKYDISVAQGFVMERKEPQRAYMSIPRQLICLLEMGPLPLEVICGGAVEVRRSSSQRI